MMLWARQPMRFFVLGSVGGILPGYALFRLLLGLPEMTSMGLGMVLRWPRLGRSAGGVGTATA